MRKNGKFSDRIVVGQKIADSEMRFSGSSGSGILQQ